jgi:hypothetical protein
VVCRWCVVHPVQKLVPLTMACGGDGPIAFNKSINL